METTKKAFMGSFFMMAVLGFGMGSYNSMKLNNDAFMADDYGIKFAKRLDEMNGKVTVGRMAASLKPVVQKVVNSPAIVPVEKKIVLAQSPQSKTTTSNAKDEVLEEQEPAIKDTGKMGLIGGLFNGKPLKQGEDFEAETQVADGYVQGFTLTLPGIDEPIDLRIDQHERMKGNIFTYEDIGTGEPKNALMYPVDVEKGLYMITFAADSEYPGMRLEFKVGGENKVAHFEEQNNANTNFAQLNDQNEGAEEAQPYDDNFDGDVQPYDQDFAENNSEDLGAFGSEVDQEGYSF